jgi:uncharacterized RDD family membrane protein YckC
VSGPEISVLPDQAEAFQGLPAGIVSRTLAATIDVTVVATSLLVGYGAACAALLAWSPRQFEFPDPSAVFSIVIAGSVATVYLTVAWWITGRTIGDAALGVRVVGRGGGDLRFLQALLRAGLCVLFPLGLAWCAVDSRARAVHDILVRSQVIYDWRHHTR